MKTITLPRELFKEEGLVIIPRSDYEEFLSLKKVISLVNATSSEKKAIQAGRKEIKNGKYLNLKQLKNELES
ncbi:MAG: hypothetical protein ABIG88_03030 [Patescibacteria group bacterium]|nr:hypothetical protein [Patescibacteria group bacterium]